MQPGDTLQFLQLQLMSASVGVNFHLNEGISIEVEEGTRVTLISE